MFPRRRSVVLATYLMLSIALLLFGLLWLLQSPPSAHAQSQPEALGSISGVVLDDQDDPLSDITVWLEQYPDPYPLRSVATDAEGAYTFHSVLPGTYQLRFEDPREIYTPLYYQAAHFAEDAEDIVVSGNDVTGIDMELGVGGAISVTLQSPSELPLSYAILKVYRQTTVGYWLLYRTAFVSPSQETTRIGALPSGHYRLCAQFSLVHDYNPITECYDNIIAENVDRLPPNAADIPVQTGAVTEITMALDEIIQLEGYVRGPDDAPLANIVVIAHNVEGLGDRYNSTNGNGYFRFGQLPSGNYSVQFNPAPYSYWQPDPFLPASYPSLAATPNSVSISPETRISITTHLTPEARIIGKVTLPGDVPYGYPMIVTYHQKPDGTWGNPGECYEFCPQVFYEPATGAFTMTQMAAGTYRVRSQHALPNGIDLLTGFYGGASFESAADIVLEAGETATGINIVVGEANFDGVITGLVTADGSPKEGVEVGLFQYYAYNAMPDMPFIFTKTDNQGRYRFEGLAAGTYRVGVRDPAGSYAITFYANPGDPLNSEFVALPENATLSDIDIALSRGGAIRGRVLTEEGKHPGGFEIFLLQDGDPYYGAATLPFVDARTDAGGAFEIQGVPPGTYHVLARSPQGSPEYNSQESRFYPATHEYFFAKQIEVQAGQTRAGVDIYFTVVPEQFLPFVGSK
ncbi:MAG: carboxypeptidase regulatory-like domain-containing protein [Caldilineaceae bacterium]|nr:carboxypeptidase regulatory-like domain-containing protein [Caldilineaceae bacterium]